MIAATVSRFVPFISPEEIQSQRIEAYKILRESDTPMTASEVNEQMPMDVEHCHVQTRIRDNLVEEGYAVETPKRRCTVKDHDIPVKTYYVDTDSMPVPEEVVQE